MRTIAAEHVISLHRAIIQRTGGSTGIRDHGTVETAVAQPRMSFGGKDLYATIASKAAAMPHTLITATLSSTETSAWDMLLSRQRSKRRLRCFLNERKGVNEIDRVFDLLF